MSCREGRCDRTTYRGAPLVPSSDSRRVSVSPTAALPGIDVAPGSGDRAVKRLVVRAKPRPDEVEHGHPSIPSPRKHSANHGHTVASNVHVHDLLRRATRPASVTSYL